MRTIPLVLLVLFIMTMFLWLLILLGAVALAASGWLPFFAVLILGAAIFAGSPASPARP